MRNGKVILLLAIAVLFIVIIMTASNSMTVAVAQGEGTPTATPAPTATPTPQAYLGDPLEDVTIEHPASAVPTQSPHYYEYGAVPGATLKKYSPYTVSEVHGFNFESPLSDGLVALIWNQSVGDCSGLSAQSSLDVPVDGKPFWPQSGGHYDTGLQCHALEGVLPKTAGQLCSDLLPGQSYQIGATYSTEFGLTGLIGVGWSLYDPGETCVVGIGEMRTVYYGAGDPGESGVHEYFGGVEIEVPDENELIGLAFETTTTCEAVRRMSSSRAELTGQQIWGDSTNGLADGAYCYTKYNDDEMCEELMPGAEIIHQYGDISTWTGLMSAAWGAYSSPDDECRAEITNIQPIYYGYPPPEEVCPYTPGETLTTYQVAANLVGGDVIPVYFTAGEFYSISIINPPWLDGDTDNLSFGAEIAFSYPANPADPALWHPIEEIAGACTSGGSTYFQAPPNTSSGFYTIREHYPAGNWSNNTGDVNYTVTTATYVPNPSECAMNFGYDGYYGNGRIYGNYADGIDMPIHGELEPNRWYALDILGGPWYDNGLASYDVQISADNGQTWVDLPNWTGSGQCYSQTGYGTSTTIFEAETGEDYKLRVDDDGGNFTDNTGYMQWNLYFAINMAPEPGVDCSAQFELGDIVTSSFINANLADGGKVYPFHPTEIIPDNWYALEIIPPPWWDADANLLSTRADISTGPHDPLPAQWFPLESFPGASCQETIDGYYTRIYFQAQLGDDYLLRAHDGNANWGGNTGRVSYNLYNVTPSEINPPPVGCEADFGTGYWIGGSEIDPAAETGELIVSPITDKWYRLDTSEGPWLDDGVESYLIDVSSDNGFTWSQIVFAPFATCVVGLGDNHTRIYWPGQPGYTYKIRVRDDQGDYENNTGSIRYDLYSVGYTPDDPGDDPGSSVPPWWEGNPICYTSCIRPSSGINIPAWLEYGR